MSDDLEVWRIPCLIFLDAGDVEFLEQARRAADEIPDAEVLSLAGPDHYGGHTSETRPSSSQTQLPCAATFWADVR